MVMLKSLISQDFMAGSYDDPTQLVEVFEIYDDGGAILAAVPSVLATLQASVTANRLPRAGDAYTGSFSTVTLNGTLRCRSVRLTGSGSLSTKYLAEVVWDSMYSYRAELEAAKLTPRRNVVHQLTPIELYRSLADCTLPTGTTGGGSDIAGTKLDEGGRPIRQPRQQAVVQVNWRLDSIATQLDTIDAALRDNLNKLCSVAVLGYPAFSMLLQSAELTHERDEYWNVGLRALYDPLFHWQQDAEVDGDGVVKLASGKASVVRWKRDLASADWSTLLGDAWFKHRAQNGEKAYP